MMLEPVRRRFGRQKPCSMIFSRVAFDGTNKQLGMTDRPCHILETSIFQCFPNVAELKSPVNERRIVIMQVVNSLFILPSLIEQESMFVFPATSDKNRLSSF